MQGFKPYLLLMMTAASMLTAGFSYSDEVSLSDLLAWVVFDLEEGSRFNRDTEPVRRSVIDGVIAYEYLAPNHFYRRTEKEYEKYSPSSKYKRHHYAFRQQEPCAVQIEITHESSQGDSKEVFGVGLIRHDNIFDLRRYKSVDFERYSTAQGVFIVDGDKVFCHRRQGMIQKCDDVFEGPSGPKDLHFQSAETTDQYFENKYKMVEAIRRLCPGRSG